MNGRRIRAVIRKEWLEIRRNKTILATMSLMPLLLTAVTLGMSYFLSHQPPGHMHGTEQMHLPPELVRYGASGAVLVLLNDQFMFMMLIIPMSIPIAIAAHSIVGEKETRSIEPLLATPVTTTELLLAKTIAAVTPAIVIGWASYALVAIGHAILGPPVLLAMTLRPVWTVGMLVHAPMLAVLSTLSGVVASSRYNDPRAAQGVSAFFILPVLMGGMAFVMGGIFKGIMLRLEYALLAGVVLLGVNAILLRVAVRVFERETILTRWK